MPYGRKPTAVVRTRAQGDAEPRLRWPNYLEHFKAFRYLFPPQGKPEVCGGGGGEIKALTSDALGDFDQTSYAFIPLLRTLVGVERYQTLIPGPQVWRIRPVTIGRLEFGLISGLRFGLLQLNPWHQRAPIWEGNGVQRSGKKDGRQGR